MSDPAPADEDCSDVPPPLPPGAEKRNYFYLAIAYLAIALGALGVVLPLLPTTPFILLAAFCFQKGSDRLHRWLMEHPRFGPLIADWRERGAIPRKAKRNAMIALAAVLAISWLVGVRPLIIGIQAV